MERVKARGPRSPVLSGIAALAALLWMLLPALAMPVAAATRPEDSTVPIDAVIIFASDTCTPTSGFSSIGSNFNGTAIAGGNYIWFNSVFTADPAPAGTVINFTGGTITFTDPATNTPYNLAVPNAQITYGPAGTVATTTFNTATNTWQTVVPETGLAGNIFLTGLAFQVPAGGLPGGINPVTWSGTFTSNTAGQQIGWQWAAAVYTSFSTNYNTLGVKPVDDNSASIYQNSDHAGTPENFKAFVTGGARGGGGSNFTGSYSGTGHVCTAETPPPPATPELPALALFGSGALGLIGYARLRLRRR